MKTYLITDRVLGSRGALHPDPRRRRSGRTNRRTTFHPGQLDEGQRSLLVSNSQTDFNTIAPKT